MVSRRLIVAAIAGVVGAVLVVVLALAMARNPEVQNNLGEKVFTVGDAKSLAEEVDKRGPLLFQDLLGGDRDILVDHARGDEWFAYAAVLVDGCRLELDRKSGDVKNQCTGAPLRATSIEFLCTPGLRPFSIVVNEDGELVIDLNKFVATPSCGS